MAVDLEKLNEYIQYDPLTGIIIWKKDKGNRKAGSVVGGKFGKEGYLRMKIFGKNYLSHRMAWLLSYGSIPNDEIDHINQNTSDNRLSNLRLVSGSENKKNKKRYKNNSSGIVGVRWYSKTSRWVASISIDGNQIHLGYFAEFSDAVNARKNAEVLYGYHANHGKG